MGKNVNSGLPSCFTTVAQDIKTFLCVLFFFFFFAETAEHAYLRKHTVRKLGRLECVEKTGN